MFILKKENEDVAGKFVRVLHMITEKIHENFYKSPEKVIITKEQQLSFNKANLFHICEGGLGKYKVGDHCHFTGNYRGAAHKYCILRFKKPKVLPVIFHNLSFYSLILSKFITYLDANNLYRWAMSKKLSTHEFKWMNPVEDFYN